MDKKNSVIPTRKDTHRKYNVDSNLSVYPGSCNELSKLCILGGSTKQWHAKLGGTPVHNHTYCPIILCISHPSPAYITRIKIDYPVM